MKNFLFLLIGLTLSMLALPSYAEFCDFPYSEPIEGEFAEVGQAVDSDRQRFKVLNAFEGVLSEVGSGVGTLSASLLTDRDEIFNKVSKEKSGSIKIGFFQFGKSRKFTNITLNQKYTATFVLVFETTISNAKWKIDTSSGSPLTAYAQRFVDKPCEFKKLFGDSFIFQAQRGAQVYVAINVSFSSDIHYQQFIKGKGTGAADAMGSMINTKLSDWTDKITGKIANLDLGFSFKKSSENTSRTTLEDGKVEIVAMQVGGDTSRLGQIFGTGGDVAIASCRLSALVDTPTGQPTGGDPASIDNCSKAFNSVLAYLAQEEFATGVKEKPATLSYLYRPYWEVDPSIQLVKEITPAIEDARTQLATELSNRERDLSKIKNLLISSLTEVHRQELITLQSNLEQDIQRLLTAGFTCFSDLVSCESLSIQVLGSLTVYRQSVLQLYLEDGLVAYYPFNTNSLDESGNGNHGTVHGATLVQDRLGNLNSAYQFNNSYIEIPHNNSFNVTQTGFSLALWFKPESNQKSTIYTLIDKSHGITGVNSWVTHCVNDRRYGATPLFGFATGDGTNWTASYDTSCLYDNQWHFITSVSDDSVIKFYVDGSLKQTATLLGTPLSNQSRILIGTSGYPNRTFTGSIDDIRFYNRVLSEAEIQRLYTGDIIPIETYHLSVNKTGDGNVTGAGDYEANSSVTLTAVANANSQFIGWSGDCSGTTNSTTLLMDANKTCTAKFSQKTTDPTGEPKPKPICDNPFLPCDEPAKSSDKCTASYQNNTLIIPCLNIANLFTTETYQVELKQQLFSMTFNVNMESLQSKSTVKDACAAEYKGANGEVHVPCVEITGTGNMYDVYLQQQPSTLLFDLDMKRLVKIK